MMIDGVEYRELAKVQYGESSFKTFESLPKAIAFYVEKTKQQVGPYLFLWYRETEKRYPEWNRVLIVTLRIDLEWVGWNDQGELLDLCNIEEGDSDG